MAFLPGTIEDEEKQTLGEDTPIIPGAGGGAGQGALGTGPVSLEQPTQSTAATPDVVDTASYLAANRPQAESLGGFLGGKIESEQSEISGDIGEQFGGYQSEIAAGRTDLDQDLIDRAALDPTGFTADPEDVKRFTAQREAQYTGPESIEQQDFYGDISGRIEGAERRVGQVETETGREGLLFELSGGNPTQGQVTLDQLLLSQNPNVRESLAEVAGRSAGVRGEFEQQAGASRDARVGAVGEAQRARDAVQERFYGEGGVVPEFEQGLEDRFQEERTTQTRQSEAALADLLDKGEMTPETAAYYGIGEGRGGEAHQDFLRDLKALQRDYGSPLRVEDYIQRYTAEGKIPTIESVANLEDLAQQQSLKQLLGVDYYGPLQEGLVSDDPNNFKLSKFDTRESGLQTMTALGSADASLIEAGLAGIPMENGILTDKAASDQFYNMIQRNPIVLQNRGSESQQFQAFVRIYEEQFGAGEIPIEPPTPTDDSPWEEGQSRLRVIKDPEIPVIDPDDPDAETGTPYGASQQWWDGQQWTEAPTEIRYEDAAGNPSGPDGRSKTYQFDYETGEYNLIEELEQPGTTIGAPGVVSAF